MQITALGHSRPGTVPNHNQRLLSKYSVNNIGSQVVLIVYDMTDPASFKEIEDYWIQQAKNNSDSDIMICLVGNKCDMPAQVQDCDIKLLVQNIGLPSYYVSAKTGEGVQAMFLEVCGKLIKTATLRRREKLDSRLQNSEKVKKGCCK